MTMKRVLLVCYYFPPLGGAGVGRPLSLFRYLPQFGYECDLLTVKPVAYRGYEPELLEGLDQSRIYR
ncbi:MAG: glycosyl transferase family 1, partial [candidate division Zixibacteria bacterium]|nr:glycosyl transferase family 1 [candidate division Zixibacteria bacterium]